MRFAAVSLSLFCVSFAVAGCEHQRTSDAGGNHSASENAIYLAMGRGLLGSSLDTMRMPDRRKALEAEYKALEYTQSGKTVTWSSDKGVASGTVAPGQPYRVGSQNCRQYSHNFVINGVPQNQRGSACRNDDGSWSPLT